jgi:hypothetical protein
MVLAAVLATVLATAVFHRDVVGWWRGEAKYRGRYTNSWRAELRQYHRWVGQYPSSILTDAKTPDSFYVQMPTRLEQLLAKLWPTRYPIEVWLDPPLQQGDTQALPVLLQLLNAPEPNVRVLAIRGLGNVGPAAREAVPILLAALDDDGDGVADEAAAALIAIDPQALERVGMGR